MSIATSSVTLTLLFAWALLYILMDVNYKEMSKRQRIIFFGFFIILALFNEFLSFYTKEGVYAKTILFTMHLPTFFAFLYIKKYGVLKTAFMIVTALVFTSPAIVVDKLLPQAINTGLTHLISNTITFTLTLVLAHFLFRKGFNYLLKYGSNASFAKLFIVPLMYYIYIFGRLVSDVTTYNLFGTIAVKYLPTLQIYVFYFLLIYNYKDLCERRELETMQVALEQELDSAKNQINMLNEASVQTAIYQHDMRHHLTVISSFLASDMPDKAVDYINKVKKDIDAITPKRFCENEIVNLLCSFFHNKAEHIGIKLKVDVKLPCALHVSDTELCSVISNGLENALNAAEKVSTGKREVELYCSSKKNRILIEVKNPYTGEVIMADGVPVSDKAGHGFGCRSIYSITEKYNGLCSFEAVDGVFTLRVVLPDTKKE